MAAASMAPTALKAAGFFITTSTGYFHCINRVQPRSQLVSTSCYKSSIAVQFHVLQYAHRRPRYFPIKGTRTMLRSSSSCSILSCHSASASEKSSDRVSRSESVVDSEGREAISSSDSEYEFCREGTMYADIENEGFDPAGEGEDIGADSDIRSETEKERKTDQAVACLLPCK